MGIKQGFKLFNFLVFQSRYRTHQHQNLLQVLKIICFQYLFLIKGFALINHLSTALYFFPSIRLFTFTFFKYFHHPMYKAHQISFCSFPSDLLFLTYFLKDFK